MPLLRAEQLLRRHAAAEVVRGVSLALKMQESVALIGASGSGKTSLLHMLGLLDRPTSGRIYLDEIDMWQLSATERAYQRLRRIGFVFQRHNLLPHLSVRDNVALPAWRLFGSRSHALRRGDELLERLEIGAKASALAGTLSSGEAQRAAIARALINEPQLVLADEPTGSLDSTAAAIVTKLLLEICSQGSALLIVTHDSAVAARAQRVLQMMDGLVS